MKREHEEEVPPASAAAVPRDGEGCPSGIGTDALPRVGHRPWPSCPCGRQGRRLVSQTLANPDRAFFKCPAPNCGAKVPLWVWEDCYQLGLDHSGPLPTDTCYRCQEQGHWAKHCPHLTDWHPSGLFDQFDNEFDYEFGCGCDCYDDGCSEDEAEDEAEEDCFYDRLPAHKAIPIECDYSLGPAPSSLAAAGIKRTPCTSGSPSTPADRVTQQHLSSTRSKRCRAVVDVTPNSKAAPTAAGTAKGPPGKSQFCCDSSNGSSSGSSGKSSSPAPKRKVIRSSKAMPSQGQKFTPSHGKSKSRGSQAQAG